MTLIAVEFVNWHRIEVSHCKIIPLPLAGCSAQAAIPPPTVLKSLLFICVCFLELMRLKQHNTTSTQQGMIAIEKHLFI